MIVTRFRVQKNAVKYLNVQFYLVGDIHGALGKIKLEIKIKYTHTKYLSDNCIQKIVQLTDASGGLAF